MPDPAPTGYLVQQREDGFGPVTPLPAGARLTVGRAPSNRLVVKDDLASRNHAELVPAGGGWAVRDLSSLNGSFVNDQPAKGEVPLRTRDRVRFGRTAFLFVEDLGHLPHLPAAAGPPAGEPSSRIEITRRLGQTKYLPPASPPPPPAPPPAADGQTVQQPLPPARGGPADALAVLYQLAFDMAQAQTPAELAELVVRALFKATPAEVGAVLTVAPGGDPEPLTHLSVLPFRTTYHKVSGFVSQEVLGNRQAVLAEDVSADRHLRDRDSLTDLRATSLICAPVEAEGQVLGLLHLYRTGGAVRLTPDDLEVALAAARQLGLAWHGLKQRAGLAVENRELRDSLRKDSELVGASPALRRVEEQAVRVAATKATVLVRGESGVGKELVARAIHFNSPRRDGPFVTLNCAALTETLLESELFGHEKGAFTGATERMIGKFEAADGGTIFLDEIGEMAPNTQAKLLRVLEGQPFERVGGNVPITVDVRVVAATNRPLEEAVKDGTFRRDLYFRLQVVQIDVPPLRDRPEDVPAIAEHFLRRFSREVGRKVKGFNPQAVSKLQGHRWPGNVRELRNVVERAVALGTAPQVEAEDVWLSPLDLADEATPVEAYRPVSLDEVEKEHIRRTLAHTEWNKSRAASILGVERSTLDRKIKAYGLAPGP
jgi:Nif-specific regulatory protein